MKNLADEINKEWLDRMDPEIAMGITGGISVCGDSKWLITSVFKELKPKMIVALDAWLKASLHESNVYRSREIPLEEKGTQMQSSSEAAKNASLELDRVVGEFLYEIKNPNL